MNLNSIYREKIDAIKSRINESINKSNNSSDCSDNLRFLIDRKIKFNLEDRITDKFEFKNSNYKKAKYLIFALISICFICLLLKTKTNVSILPIILIGTVLSGIAIYFFISFIEDNFVFSVDSEGIFINNQGFVKWKNIIYLYFKTKYDGDCGLKGKYLIISLNDDTEIEIAVENLVESVEHLGEILYMYLQKVNK